MWGRRGAAGGFFGGGGGGWGGGDIPSLPVGAGTGGNTTPENIPQGVKNKGAQFASSITFGDMTL